MKTLLLILFPIILFSQYTGKVGINTSSPTETLDIDGSLRVRNIQQGNSTDFILVADGDGVIKKVLLANLLQNDCPIFIRSESSPYYLKFKSASSIQNPNSALTIEGINFVSAGTWIENNTYYYSYSNTSGQPLNINQFTVNFGNKQCNY